MEVFSNVFFLFTDDIVQNPNSLAENLKYLLNGSVSKGYNLFAVFPR